MHLRTTGLLDKELCELKNEGCPGAQPVKREAEKDAREELERAKDKRLVTIKTFCTSNEDGKRPGLMDVISQGVTVAHQ